jgi:site-specific recombinase XerD
MSPAFCRRSTTVIRRPLVIYLSPCLQTLTRIAMAAKGGQGPLFVNARGHAWRSNAINLRIRRLREKPGLPDGTVAYSHRHSFATQAILNGTDVATVAELLGHGDVGMIQKHYGHLAGEAEHLKAAAAKAVKRTG